MTDPTQAVLFDIMERALRFMRLEAEAKGGVVDGGVFRRWPGTEVRFQATVRFPKPKREGT